MPNRVPPTAISRTALLALGMIDAAYRGSDDEPVDRTDALKLALAYLQLSGLATKDHVTTLWKVLGHEGLFDQKTARQSYFGVIMDGIRQRALVLAK